MYYYDYDAVESGGISHNQESWLQTTVDVDVQETVTFWWKVSSEENYDFLQFYIDGELQHQISGEVDWQEKQYIVSGQGSHTLKWRYHKDDTVSKYEDCGWVDYVQWTGSQEPPPPPPPDPTKWDTITYKYDPAGRRIKKAGNGEAIKYYYDGGHVIAEYSGSGYLLRKYIYGPRVDEPVCMIDVSDSNARYYYHFDGTGSVVALSDSAGDTVQTYEYSVFGQVAAEDPCHPNPYMFTGRRFDIETGLYYYRARYYNPYIGRFLQTDPVGYADGMNWYRYCGNNPIGCCDPSGLRTSGLRGYKFSIPAGYFPGASGKAAYTMVNGFLREQGFYEAYPDWKLQYVTASDSGLDVTLYTDVADSCEPDFSILSMPIMEGPGDRYPTIGYVDVLTLGGVGLLNDDILHAIIDPAINRVNGWDFGNVLGLYDLYRLYFRCDTSFWLTVERLKPPFQVKMWKYKGASYTYDEINFILPGYAAQRAGLSFEFIYTFYFGRENIQEFADIDGDWFRTTEEVQGGAIWLAYGYYGL